MLDMRLYLVQRMTAMALAPFVVLHLVVMIYAIQGGVTAGEILGRTQGSLGWGLFYGGFVLAAALHGAIGLRVVAAEWLGLRGAALGAVMWGAGGVLAVMGLRAVLAVTGSAA